MKKLMLLNRRAYIIGATFSVLLILFAYYYWLYLPQQEQRLISKKVRTLHQVAQNFEDKYEVYRKNADNIFLKPEFQEIVNIYQKGIISSGSLSANTQFDIDQQPLLKNIIRDQSIISLKKKRLFDDAVNRKFTLQLNEPAQASSSNNVIRYPYRQINDSSLHIVLTTPIDDFFQPIKRSESFDGYMILKGQEVIYQNISGKMLLAPIHAIDGSLSSSSNSDSGTNQFVQYDLNEQSAKIFKPGLNVKLAAQDYKLFSTRMSVGPGKTWTLYAFSDREKFDNEKQHIPFFTLIFLSLGLLLLLFALPFIKLLLMSNIERLHSRDVVLSISSFVICPGLLVMCIIVLVSYIREMDRIDENLSALQAAIEQKTDREIQMTQQLFDAYEHGLYSQPVTSGTSGFNDIHIFSDTTLREGLRNRLRENLAHYPYLKNLYWIDEGGNLQFQLSTVTNESQKTVEDFDYRDRAYVSELMENQGWQYPGLAKPIYVQSIASWTSSEKMAVVSRKPTGDIIHLGDQPLPVRVMAASVRFHSLTDALLPPSYTFSIINSSGDVLFHSEKNKNLQENLLLETDQDNNLRSAIASHTSDYTHISYGGKEYRVLISPMQHLPWFMVVAYDKEYLQSPYLQSISMTVIIVLMLGAMSSLQLFLLTIPQRKRSILTRKLFPYDWLWPQQKHYSKYIRGCIMNLLFTLLVIVLYTVLSLNLVQLTGLFLYAMMGSTFTGWWLMKENRKLRIQNIFSCALLFAVVFILTQFLAPDLPTNLMILATVVLVMLPFIIGPTWSKTASFFESSSGNRHFKTVYNLMLTTYFFFSSVLAGSLIFVTVHEQELIAWKKYELYKIQEAKVSRDQQLEALYKSRSLVDENDLITDRAQQEALYPYEVGYHDCTCESHERVSSEREKNLFFNSRPFFSDLFVHTRGFILPKSNAEYWEEAVCHEHGLSLRFATRQNGVSTGTALASFLPSFWDMPGPIPWYLVIAAGLLVLLVWGMYQALHTSTDRFFAMDLFDYLDPVSIDDAYLRERFAGDVPTSDKTNLLVVALPFAGIEQYYENIPEIKVLNVSELLEEENIEKVSHLKGKEVVLKNFSYSIDDISKNDFRLKLLEKLMIHQNVLTVISRFSPDQILEKYEEQIKQTGDAALKEKLQVQAAKWKELMSGFTKVYYSIISQPRERLPEEYTLEDLVKYELEVNKNYFSRLKGSVITSWDDGIKLTPRLHRLKDSQDTQVKEEVLVKIQSMAQPFYYSLWNTCSKEEKYLLYDLALDGFVNTNNLRGIKKLMEKGLIYYDEALIVMNESFRNFILSTIKEAESLEMEKELRRSGTWSIYSSVILLFVLGLILFVSFAHRSLVDQFVALLAGVTAAVPYLLRLTGFFSSSSVAKNG